MFKKRFIKNGRYFFISKRIPWTPSRGAEGPGVGVAGPEKIDLKTKKLMRVPFVVGADFETCTKPISDCEPDNDKSFTRINHVGLSHRLLR